MKTIEQEYSMHPLRAKVCDAVVNPYVIQQWGGGLDVAMDDRVVSELRLWGGDIQAINLKVVVNKLLVQELFAADFNEPSEATFEFDNKAESTWVRFTYKNVPDERALDIATGWQKFYLCPLKDLLERR